MTKIAHVFTHQLSYTVPAESPARQVEFFESESAAFARIEALFNRETYAPYLKVTAWKIAPCAPFIHYETVFNA